MRLQKGYRKMRHTAKRKQEINAAPYCPYCGRRSVLRPAERIQSIYQISSTSVQDIRDVMPMLVCMKAQQNRWVAWLIRNCGINGYALTAQLTILLRRGT